VARVAERRRGGATVHRDEGYIAVDAMVALLIIALATVLSLQAVERAHSAATAADEYKTAQIVITDIMEGGPRSFTVATGNARGFSWRLVTEVTGSQHPIAICRRALTLQASRSGRTFQASTNETCPVEPIG
jgi:hypothetical protein